MAQPIASKLLVKVQVYWYLALGKVIEIVTNKDLHRDKCKTNKHNERGNSHENFGWSSDVSLSKIFVSFFRNGLRYICSGLQILQQRFVTGILESYFRWTAARFKMLRYKK